MGQPAAKQGDHITGKDTHLVKPTVTPPATVLVPELPFDGILDGKLSSTVKIGGMPAATVGSTATNTPPHVVLPPGSGVFAPPLPTNKGSIISGSSTVSINGKPAARNGDTALTCNFPIDLPNGKVVAQGTVLIGG